MSAGRERPVGRPASQHRQLRARARQKGLAILQRPKLGATGQNLVWQAEITAQRTVFHSAAEIEGQRWRVTVDRACAIVVRTDHVVVADPTTATGTVTLSITRPGAATRQLTATLPSGLRAGASVTVSLD